MHQIIAVYASGRTFQPVKDKTQTVEMRVDAAGYPAVGTLNPGRIVIRNLSDDGSDPLVKLMLPGGTARGAGKGTLTYDLTCTK